METKKIRSSPTIIEKVPKMVKKVRKIFPINSANSRLTPFNSSTASIWRAENRDVTAKARPGLTEFSDKSIAASTCAVVAGFTASLLNSSVTRVSVDGFDHC